VLECLGTGEVRGQAVAYVRPGGMIGHPSRVFDYSLPLAEVAEAYRAMDERRAIKVLLQP